MTDKLSLKIKFVNPANHPIKTREIRKIIFDYLSWKKYCGKIEIVISIVDEKTIQSLNRRFRCQNKVTDVLSFGAGQIVAGQTSSQPILLGEIILCWQQIQKQYRDFSESVDQEIETLILHSLNHLCGGD